MAITGYTNKLSVIQGDSIKFMINCDVHDSYDVQLVELISGDTAPESPGFKVNKIDVPINKNYPGKKQEINMGSFIKFDNNEVFNQLESFSLQTMIYPTLPKKGIQSIMSKWSSEEETGYGLFIDENGSIALWLGSNNHIDKVSTNISLVKNAWYFVGATYNAETNEVFVFQKPVVSGTNSKFSSQIGLDKIDASNTETVSTFSTKNNEAPFLIASSYKDVRGKNKDVIIPAYKYNGKIDRPRVANRVLSIEEMGLWIEQPSRNGLVAAWDFSYEITRKGIKKPESVHDMSANQIHGHTVNLPTRAMTGYNWDSTEQNFVHAPEQYGAIHFHDDDLIDAKWDVDFELEVPKNLKSGVYAAHVYSGEDEDYVTFFVRPPTGKPQAKIAFLAPTASYLAYANNRFQDIPLAQLMFGRAPVVESEDEYLGTHSEYGLSTYDHHTDGTGVSHSSSLRPILNMRPIYRHNLSPSLWQFNADLHLVDWMTEKGFEFDVITDSDLHDEGLDILKHYNVVITGSHPEYYSGQMLDTVEAYQDQGGRFMYMGANGFYWVTEYHPTNSNIIEVRKNFGNNAWKTLPGELNISFTGEQGSLWRHRGRAPQKIAGTGFIAQGFDISSYYMRTESSHKQEYDWIFEGIEDEKLGDFGLVGGGAAGLELDIYDTDLGTPDHAVILASSENHNSTYMQVAEELHFNLPGMSGEENPRVRADIVYYKTPNDGAVFSTSSIAYCGSLPHNNYENNISKLTENILKTFASDEKLPN